MRLFTRLFAYAVIIVVVGTLLGAGSVGAAYWLVQPRLPSVGKLKNVELQVPMRVRSADGKTIATFGTRHRIPVHINQVAPALTHAVMAAEDADFYHHNGFDLTGTLRAAFNVIMAGGRKTQGGSTITQQVARNFFLSSQKTYTRKVTEIFTAMRMEDELSKDKILELYLNKMFLGNRSYGVGAAAQYYYGKTAADLDLAESAMLAATFQLPSLVNPLHGGQRALNRRNWVLGQMYDNGFISRDAHDAAVKEPRHASAHKPPIEVNAPYVAEMVREKAVQLFGNSAMTGGYVVHTTIDSKAQHDAVAALRHGLEAYNHRHGYRGPEDHVDLPNATDNADLDAALDKYYPIAGLLPGLVTSVDDNAAAVHLPDGRQITLNHDAVAWAKPYDKNMYAGRKPDSVAAVLDRGDVIRVTQDDEDNWQLMQVPQVDSGLVSLAPEDGSVTALVGGYSFRVSKYNRVLMPNSGRQPGSGFKPFVYSAAFDHGFTPASIINDAPVAFNNPTSPDEMWTPSNDNGEFSGPMRLRKALYLSKNLVSIRLLNATGLNFVRRYDARFGLDPDQLPANLSLALGTASVSPMQMARGYAVFANGGFLIQPHVISSIDDRTGQTIYRADAPRACRNCKERLLAEGGKGKHTSKLARGSSSNKPVLVPVDPDAKHNGDKDKPRLAPHTISTRTAYLMYSVMKDVINRGTGHAASQLGRDDLAGKTGSTDNHHDAWFTGFNADVVTSVWVGFDNYATLGYGEFGSRAALPIWMDYMGSVLDDSPSSTLPKPPGITSVLINKDSGLPTDSDDPDAMQEYFKVEDVGRLREKARHQHNQLEQEQGIDIF